ncbi:MAG TPA: hypothetical protein VMB26_06155 [Candidatus Binataceae bacterium]|nr:hypothetical protein [Candidatus Binataceae bacterium]
MIDHEAISDTRRSATSAAQPTDGSDSASINSSVVSSQVAKQSAFRSDSLAAFFRRTPHYGFLSWQDLRSLVRTPTFPADKHYIVFAPDTQAEADVNAPEQPQTHFRPLAEIQFGDYSLPVYLGVRDAEHCCQ